MQKVEIGPNLVNDTLPAKNLEVQITIYDYENVWSHILTNFGSWFCPIQWRIQNFPEVGGNSPEFGPPGASLAPPLDPPLQMTLRNVALSIPNLPL